MTSDFQDAFNTGVASKTVQVSINGVEHIQVPPNCTLKSMEKLMPAPIRIREHPSFSDIDGFSSYVEQFKEKGSRIFVDDNNWSFTTIFDCHDKDKPAWGDHSASMKVILSSEWKRFTTYDGKRMVPYDFAEFLEDNIEYLSAEEDLTGADLLSMAQTFKIRVKGDVQVNESLTQGMKLLLIKDDSVVRGVNKEGTEVSFPESLRFDLRIFKNHKAFPIRVFLRTRHDNTKLEFFIKIPDPEGLQEEAFDKVIEAVKDATELPTLKGSYSGPEHK